jgi:cytochrome P450
MLLVLAAANRDPAKYADPDRLDIARSPNPHVALGQGIHACLGAPLARLETQEAFLALPQRFPDLRLDIDPASLEYQPTIVARALKSLPVAW